MSIKGRLIFISLLLFTMYLIQCGDGPTKQNEFLNYVNKAPDTFISAKTLTKVKIESDESGNPTNVNTFAFTVSFGGTDVDGNIISFTYKIDNGASVLDSVNKTISGTFEISSATDVHFFEVFATDDRGTPDPTPAKAEFSLNEINANNPPNTSFDSAPVNGSEVGQGFIISFSGDDADGMVIKFKYSIDGGDPVELDADDNGKASVEFSVANSNTFAAGNHSFSVAAIDNYGAEDESPTAVSFSVVAGFKPVIQFTAGPADGGLWFSNVDAAFSYNAIMSHYFGKLDANGWAYSFDGVDFTEFGPDGSALIIGALVGDGAHSIVVRAKDLGGAIGEATINFESAAATFSKNLALIDDNDNDEQFSPQDFVDLFTAAGYPPDTYWDVPGNSGGPSDGSGTGLFSPAEIGQYKTIVIWTDNSPDLGGFGPLFSAYVKAGGNVVLTSYRLRAFTKSGSDTNPTTGFLFDTAGVIRLFFDSASAARNFTGVDDSWPSKVNSWARTVNDALFGTSWRATSNFNTVIMRAADDEITSSILRATDSADNRIGYPRGIFRDNPLPQGNVVTLGQSFRRLAKTDPDPTAFITALMKLVTKDN